MNVWLMTGRIEGADTNQPGCSGLGPIWDHTLYTRPDNPHADTPGSPVHTALLTWTDAKPHVLWVKWFAL
jgi:hypothetical protein